MKNFYSTKIIIQELIIQNKMSEAQARSLAKSQGFSESQINEVIQNEKNREKIKTDMINGNIKTSNESNSFERGQ